MRRAAFPQQGLQIQLPQQPDELTVLRNKIVELDLQIALSRTKLNETEGELRKQVSINESLSRNPLFTSNLDQRAKWEKAQTAFKKLGERLTEQTREAKGLNLQYELLKGRISSLSTQNAELQKELTVREATIVQLTEQLAASQRKLESLTLQLSTATEKNAKLEAENLRLTKTIETLSGNQEQKEKQLLAQIAELELKLKERDALVSEQGEQISTLAARVSTLESSHQRKETEIRSLTASCSAKTEELRKTGESFSQSQLNLGIAKLDIETLQANCKRLESLLDFTFPEEDEDPNQSPAPTRVAPASTADDDFGVRSVPPSPESKPESPKSL